MARTRLRRVRLSSLGEFGCLVIADGVHVEDIQFVLNFVLLIYQL